MVMKTNLGDEKEESYVLDDNEVDHLFDDLDGSSLE